MTALVLALLVSQVQTLDEGTKLGRKLELNFVGAGVTCVSTSATRATCTVTSGGGSGLPADPAACTSGQYVIDLDGSGVLTCAQVAYSQISGTPSLPLSMANGGTGIATAPDNFTIVGNGTGWAHANLGGCSGANAALQYVDASNAFGCNNVVASTAETYIVQTPTSGLSAEQALSSLSTGLLKVTTGTGVLSTAAAGDVPTPVGSASALASNPTDCSFSSQYAQSIDASGNLTCKQPVYSELSSIPSTFAPVDATSLVTGGVRLTGDLGGTATSPSVVDDSHAHTTTTISGLDAGADFTAGVLPGARGGGGAALPTCAGTDKLTANGTTWSCAADQTGGGGGGISPLTVAAFGGF